MPGTIQDRYYKYLEQDLYNISHIPDLNIIKFFVNGGVDLNGFVFTKYVSKYDKEAPAFTLLFALVHLIPSFSGTKSRLQRILDVMEYILSEGANIEEGYSKVKTKSRIPQVYIKRPLEHAIEKRITPAIRVLVSHGASVTGSDKQKWLQYIAEASGHEQERLVQVMKLLQPGYVFRDPNLPEERNVPHNAINVISQEDINDGQLMVNINDEFYGDQGVLGSHSHFYTKESWDAYEKFQKQSGQPILSPYTRKLVRSKVTYKAKKLPKPSEEENKKDAENETENKTATSNNSTNSGTANASVSATASASASATNTNSQTHSNNNTHGGKRRGRKKTRKSFKK